MDCGVLMTIGGSQKHASIKHDLPNEASLFAFRTMKRVGTRSDEPIA
jgi:hypothetical protein